MFSQGLRRNLLGVIIFPVIAWLLIAPVELLVGRNLSGALLIAIGFYALMSQFLLPPVVSGLVAKSKPAIVGFFGSVFYSLIIWLLFRPLVLSPESDLAIVEFATSTAYNGNILFAVAVFLSIVAAFTSSLISALVFNIQERRKISANL